MEHITTPSAALPKIVMFPELTGEPEATLLPCTELTIDKFFNQLGSMKQIFHRRLLQCSGCVGAVG